MTIWDMAVNDVVLVVLALAGLSYLGLSLRHVLSFRQQTEVPDIAILPPVSVLKPLCGAEPRLYDCLRSFCEQDYPDFQIVFGVRESGDPAVAVVERLIAEFPHRDIALVCDARLHGANLKISNVMNILPSCRHDILVVSDSDVAVGPHCLRALVADAVADPLVGAVSCIYRGVPTQGWASVLGALNINAWIVRYMERRESI